MYCHIQNGCDNTPLANPHYLKLLKYSWPSDHLVVSLISGQGYFTFLYRYTKHNIHNREGGRKENEQTQTWVSSKHKKGEDCDTFLAFYELSRACIWVKVTRNADSSSHIGQPSLWIHTSQQSASPHFYVLPSSLFCLPLSTGLFCRLLLTLEPSFPRLLLVSWEISCASPLCGFHAKTDKGIFWLALSHTHTTNAHIMSHENFRLNLLFNNWYGWC